MLIECLIERDGHTVVNVQRNRYEFKRNDEGRQICNILSASHSEYLLKLPDFVKYEPKVVENKPVDKAVDVPVLFEFVAEPEQPAIKNTHTCDICGKQFSHHFALTGHKRGCKQ